MVGKECPQGGGGGGEKVVVVHSVLNSSNHNLIRGKQALSCSHSPHQLMVAAMYKRDLVLSAQFTSITPMITVSNQGESYSV